MQMILLAAPMTSTEAFSAGLVAQLFEPGAVLENSIEIASQLAASSPTALSLAKDAVCRGEQTSHHPRISNISDGCLADELGRDDEFERNLYYFAFGTQDKKEGVRAFLGKEKPNWNVD